MATATARRKVTAPSHVPPELVRDFDYLRDPEFLKDPFANLDKFRDTRVFWTACDGGSWVLTRAEDIQEAFRRPELFSNSTPILRLIAVTKALIPVGLDPPEHGKYRRVIAPRFFPKVIANLREGMTKTCVDLIESFLKKGKCDFVIDFAGLFPTTVFMRLLGLPLEHSAQFLEWE